MTNKKDNNDDDGKFNEQDNQDNADYEVGYKKPPKHTRFKPGQSGNKKGRPKKNESDDFLSHFCSMLNEKVTIKGPDGKRHRLRKGDVIFENQINKAMKGEPKPVALVTDFMKKAGHFDPPKDTMQRSGVIVMPPKMSVGEWIEKHSKPPPEEDEGNNHGDD